MKLYRAGIDVGSTTVKLVILNDRNEFLYGKCRRHCAHTQETLTELLQDALEQLGDCMLLPGITGSGAINLGKALEIPFVQEVVAVADALRDTAPQTDVAIELGGEDAKIIYFKGGLEERMNGVCAGGTGSFIDQMAALLRTDAAGLDQAAEQYTELYPIAARCGVFAKTDIQPLINEGASTANLAASIFQAVVNQTVSGLACGKPIRGCVAFLGGPLHFMPQLKAAFIRTLHLTPENVVDPENSHLFAAKGAAMEEKDCAPVQLSELTERLKKGVEMNFELKRLAPLFASEKEYTAFCERHGKAKVTKGELAHYQGNCYLGIDAGSTTTKLTLIGEKGELLFSFYDSNHGNPVQTAVNAVRQLQEAMPPEARIVRSCSTGYGEGLIKAAFSLDEGEVETIAHCTAARFFDPAVDCVLDIGGQDMKCIRLKNGAVDNVMLNEACSSGCGSFIENFASSLGFTAEQFAEKALYADNPVDLGTRCTVFMNSNVKQAQKEGAKVSDISAGLAYSVIKNALFKVIKMADASDLGRHIVAQGGTFHNRAVLCALEKIAGTEVVCPDISGLMGAFGAALIARAHYTGQETSMPELRKLLQLSYTTTAARCGGCSNRCMLTINKFPHGRYVTGNRCEKGLGGEKTAEKGPDIFEYRLSRIFSYEPLKKEDAPRGEIGIPRVLNMYDRYPFWAVFFRELGFRVVLSPLSTRKIYERGMESIPSESECYPAKLTHGHVQWLIDEGVKTIFHPSVFFEHQETEDAQNHFNCPIVVAYPENIRNNVEGLTEQNVRYLHPFIAFTDCKTAGDRLVRFCKEVWGIPEKEVREAVEKAWREQEQVRKDIRAEGRRILNWMEENHRKGIVLAGRPYHVDPEINHGIPHMIASYGLAVLSEDCIPEDVQAVRPLMANDQWVYHSRLYTAAQYVTTRRDLELVQFNSFGCGLDAVTTDQVRSILEDCGKLYTCLKIDEISNLGAVRIRIRSLLAAIRQREAAEKKEAETGLCPGTDGLWPEKPVAERKEATEGLRKAEEKKEAAAGLCPAAESLSPGAYRRVEYTADMQKQKYTIIAPQMSPIHFDILEPVFRKNGYNLEVLPNDNREAIDTGLKYVNNDACFPSITVVGQVMEAVLSGRYDTDHLAVIMSQTGGCCRASNYVGFIRRALERAGLSKIPVISFNANGMEKNSGFHITPGLLVQGVRGVVLGDLIMRCLYRTRPYEKVQGSAEQLHQLWKERCIETLTKSRPAYSYARACEGIVRDFDELPLREGLKKPRVGIVGEILVKYMPLANNHLVEVLEREGAEAVVPDMIGFFDYCLYQSNYQYENLGVSYKKALISNLGLKAVAKLREPVFKALKKSKRFSVPDKIEETAKLAEQFLELGNAYGEGWFLAGEMASLIEQGVPNIVCIQPFACLPNHVVGKGVIKALRKVYPQSNVVAVDYDPGASEVNQLNRIKLMLSNARRAMET